MKQLNIQRLPKLLIFMTAFAIIGGGYLAYKSLAATTYYLSPNGNDSNPCSQSQPCKTLNRGYRIASPGDAVQLTAGTYTGDPLIDNDASKTSSSDVIIRAETGASITFTGQLFVKGSHVTVDGSAAAGGQISFQGGFKVDSANESSIANDITLAHLNARGEQSQIYTSNQVTVSDVSIGGFCYAGAPGADALNIGESWPGGEPTSITIEDSDIGDICYFPPEHPDCIAVFGVDGLIFRRNKVFWCGTQGFYTASDFGGRINNILLENNWFSDLTRPGQSDAYYILQLDDGTNIVVRYNSFGTGVDGSINISVAGPVSVYGNAGQLDGCPSGNITYAYNVWTAAKCSTTDITADPAFVQSTGGPNMNLHLQAGSPAIGRGDASKFPSTDFDGQTRTSPPDAGADEYGATGGGGGGLVPTVSLSASPAAISSGSSSTLSWNSSNATSCSASGAWSGTKATSGSQSVSPASTSTYNLSCTGSGGTVNASATVTISAAQPAQSITQTIQSGATLSGIINWKGVYDANGDGTEDDPGSIEFYVDGNLVLSEIDPPFGDTDGFWNSATVNNGQHIFKVQAVSDAGSNLVSNSLVAEVNNSSSAKPADLNNDGTVNITDLSILLSNYNSSNATADINKDGTVNILDLSILLSNYGS